jgi:hypothetical protein
MRHDTAGDPITGLKWTRKTTEKIANQLNLVGINVCPNTVGKLLKQLGYSLRVNHKKISTCSGPERDEQFCYLSSIRDNFMAEGLPVISVDTKKKELVGNFHNKGVAWEQDPVKVNDHDFRSLAEGLAAPYGIYDIRGNQGFVCVGNSYDTPEFAVSSIEKWWCDLGKYHYPEKKKLLILADAGGSNGCRSRAWKYNLQKMMCDHYGIEVTVCHFPAGASKWNPIEHRLFSEISKNWAGRPLVDFGTIENYIKTTSTVSGLTVEACLVARQFEKGIKISDAQMDRLCIEKHSVLPKWNYTIRPS